MRLLRKEIVVNLTRIYDLSKGRGLKLAEFLLSYKPDIILTKENLAKKGPGYAFASAGVETVQIEAISLEDLVEKLLSENKRFVYLQIFSVPFKQEKVTSKLR